MKLEDVDEARASWMKLEMVCIQLCQGAVSAWCTDKPYIVDSVPDHMVVVAFQKLAAFIPVVVQKPRELHVGDDCFKHVETVVIDGLKYLESVVVGECSFRKEEMVTNQPTCRSLHLINCDSLKDLTIGAFSFSDYSVFEIDHVPSLESLEIGDLNEESYNFHNADLVLRSGFQRVE